MSKQFFWVLQQEIYDVVYTAKQHEHAHFHYLNIFFYSWNISISQVLQDYIYTILLPRDLQSHTDSQCYAVYDISSFSIQFEQDISSFESIFPFIIILF